MDQQAGRAEKTDMLTEDLAHVDKSMERVKVSCLSSSKKLQACMLSTGPDVEKRRRKLHQVEDLMLRITKLICLIHLIIV